MLNTKNVRISNIKPASYNHNWMSSNSYKFVIILDLIYISDSQVDVLHLIVIFN